MSELRRLCQALLDGPATPADLSAAETLLNGHLADTELSDALLGEPWVHADLPEPEDATARRSTLRALAPTQLLAGTWLARAAQPATAHRPTQAHLLNLYCRIVGLDDPARSPPLRFRAKLIAEGIHLPPLTHPGFFGAFDEADLAFPAIHLTLMHRPRRYFPELLGYTLAHVLREPEGWDTKDTDLRETCRTLAWAALEAYPHREAEAERIRRGWNLYRRLFDELALSLRERLPLSRTAQEAMAEILKAKRSQAIGYHGRVMLEGRSLDAWLSDGADNPGPLLNALRASPYVKPACPSASALIRAMEFGGPMFGVFEPEERRACLDWITAPSAPAVGYAPRTCGAALVRDAYPTKPGRSKPNPRQLFAALLRAESPADCPPEADALIRRVLRRARWLSPLQRGANRYFPYDPARFHARIEAMHQSEVRRYRALTGPPPVSREYCRWAALQLAPAILVDGCWLFGIGNAAEPLGETGRHLLRIYADELGEGRPEWNHPNVYRRLLESLGWDLPPLDSEDFAQHPLLLDAAFDIPVYLLAMGLRAEEYFPELLGLNLAIELSGLGAGYMRVIDILRYYRIDPAIIQLHLSIDNLTSGHAARAREAVMLFLDEVRRREGAEAEQAQWRRVWTGCLSLHGVAMGLALGFLARYARERLRIGSAQRREEGSVFPS